MQLVFMFLGRVCISLIFIFSAMHKLFNWDAAHQEVASRLSDWVAFAATMPSLQGYVEFLLPLTPLLLIVGTIFESIGGILVFLGVKVRLGGVLLILFLLATTILMHAFWVSTPADKPLQMVMFMKNLAILGGLLILTACGGAKSKPKSAG